MFKMERMETYFGQHPIYAFTTGLTTLFTNFIKDFNPFLQFFIGIGSFFIILLTIEAKLKERKHGRKKTRTDTNG